MIESPIQTLLEESVPEESKVPTKVFISYSWDSEDHKERVLTLANTLRKPWGIESDIDWYVRAKPPFTPVGGWDLWMEKRIEWAEFVLIVCTETYKRRFRGDEEPGVGRGSTWEGTIIRQHLYNNHLTNTKFIPVVFSSQDLTHVPTIFNGNDKYITEDEKSFGELCYRLRKEPTVAMPEVATTKLQEPPEPKFFIPNKPQTEPPPVSFDVSRTIKVRVHLASFSGSTTECYFINLTNVSPTKSVEVTHIWYQDEKNNVSVVKPSRTLPVRLDLDQSWETWIAVNKLPIDNHKNAYRSFYARISTGDVFKSEANLNVPRRGTVPGGSIQIQQVQQKREEVQRRQADQTISANELAFEKGIDYTQLRDLLIAGKWKEADQETADLMFEVMGRQKEGWLRVEDIQNFPCTDLRTIDQLWVQYSNSKFGFSVQKKIWREHSSPTTYNANWEKFGEVVGWKKKGLGFMSDWKTYGELAFDTSAPSGHLPSLLGIGMASGLEGQFLMIGLVSSGLGLFSRVKICRL